MHAASLMRSKRLQRVHRVLSDGKEHSTRDLMWAADVCAVSTIVGELRENGCEIDCRQVHTESGPIWLYRMSKGAISLEEAQAQECRQ